MLRRILHPIDLSPQSLEGAKWILDSLATPRTSLLLVHVVNPEAGLETPGLVRDAEEHMGPLEEELLALHGGISSLVIAGDDEEVLAEVAHREKCSLVAHVIHSEDDPLPLIRPIPLPHLLIPLRNDGTLPAGDLFSRMVVATVLAPDRTDALLESRRRVAEGRTRQTVLLHAVPLDDPGAAEELVMAADEALQAVKESLLPWGGEVTARLVSGDPNEELPAVLEELAPSLLVLGLSRHGEMWGLLVGSTAEALIGAAKSPVLLIPT